MKQVSRKVFLEKFSLAAGASLLPGAFDSLHALNGSAREFEGKKLNIALCGLGRYAGYLAEGLAVSKHCNLAGIVTGTPEKAVKWQKQYNIPGGNIYNYENFDRIIDNKGIDLVYVVLPNAMHKAFCIRAAKAGKHVIVEKPMATSAADCVEMIDACKSAGVQLAVGYRLHYEPTHQEIMRLGQQKVFGEVRLIEVSLGYSLAFSDTNDWHLKKALGGGGPLMNLGVYCVQAGRYILGQEPVAVTAQFAPVTDSKLFSEVEESITWQLHFPGGAVCTSTSAYNCNIDRLYAAATDGFFELSPAVSYGPFRGRSSNGPIEFPVINQQAAQLDGIASALLEGKELPAHINGSEGLKDLKVIDAIYQAAASGKKVIL